MRALVQRVTDADVTVNGEVTGKIGKGMVALIGISKKDTRKELEYIAKKLAGLRIFDDENGVMNKSIKDINGEILAVSQFTLMGDTSEGNRPSWFNAANADDAVVLYRELIDIIKNEYNIPVQEGVFQAEMLVRINNDGPVTVIIDSEDKLTKKLLREYEENADL